MRLIPLSVTGKLAGRYSAIVDNGDYAAISAFNWTAFQAKNGAVYAYRKERMVDGRVRSVTMHRFVFEVVMGEVVPAGAFIDHIEPGPILGLDNRRANLRVSTNAQNQANSRTKRTNKSGLKGVYWRPERQRWHAVIRVSGRPRHLGYFSSSADAAAAYDAAALEAFGSYARTNAKQGAAA